jgi:hypothetical protein
MPGLRARICAAKTSNCFLLNAGELVSNACMALTALRRTAVAFSNAIGNAAVRSSKSLDRLLRSSAAV